MSNGTLFVRDSRTNKSYEIPIHRNAIRATDLGKVTAHSIDSDRANQLAHGLRIYDPGLQNTAVTESSISFSDHEQGLLLYRGYTLEQLWGADFEQMFHLLVWGTFPTEPQRSRLQLQIARYMQEIPDLVYKTILSFPTQTSPLPMIMAGLSAYLACVPDFIPAHHEATVYQTNTKFADEAILKSIAAYGVIFAIVRCHRLGLATEVPSMDLPYYDNIFRMAGLINTITTERDQIRLSCFRSFGNLNAEHGMALLVFSTLVTASSLTDPISCLLSAVAAAHGPLHFGATESAQRTLQAIKEPENVPAFIGEVKEGKRKLFGYGHRTYKGMDPRVHSIRTILKDLTYVEQPLLKVAEAIERTAEKDEYFLSRGLYPNADFYGNFVFTGIGFEIDIIPAAMLVHRIIGIMAHWREYTTDIITSAERGLYMGFTSLGNILAPSVGPILGGALNTYLGWQAIFWFLTIAAGVLFVPFLLFFPETCRTIVGNGSFPAVGWNRSLWNCTRRPITAPPVSMFPRHIGHAHSPWSALCLLVHRPVGLIILSNGVVFASYYAVTAGMPVQFEKMYNLDGLQIGLCFIPAGLGSLLSATTNGVLVDWNYRRTRCQAGLTVHKNQKEDMLGFPIEQARLQIGLPMTILASVFIVAYGVLLPLNPPLSISLSIIFAICYCITAAYSVMNALIVDLYYDRPATVMAANNFVRCFLGAGAAAAVDPLTRAIGIKWTYCIVSLTVLLVTPLLCLVSSTPKKQNTGSQVSRGQMDGAGHDIGHSRYDIRFMSQFHYVDSDKETTVIPEISGKDFDFKQKYLVLFVDLDVIVPGTRKETVVLHWYQANLSKRSKKHHLSQLVPDKDHEDYPEIEATYIPPRAPPTTHHRYVYFLFEQPSPYRFPHCFAHIFPPTMKARAGFDVANFMQAANLGFPLAINYFVGWNEPTDGDASSAVPSATTSFRALDCSKALFATLSLVA
ncbi:uncharacterized protein N7511_003628 [Penicillium nucicola]|uniref:uncharacterized protein n=1 Tax=Penicillium nucicola TaxID=1850975 RepID=UPI0025455804|nr:uncharacterized protein N7511_003628 [Penicillium nucicola]KAJ5766012.1 hypothetical protein N7511_003628 [Penicillium nucicola]